MNKSRLLGAVCALTLVQNVSDKLSEGDIVKVKVLEVDKQGRIRLSMKAVGQE
jgi:polyribonucleotide nucleotidyltransferase